MNYANDQRGRRDKFHALSPRPERKSTRKGLSRPCALSQILKLLCGASCEVLLCWGRWTAFERWWAAFVRRGWGRSKSFGTLDLLWAQNIVRIPSLSKPSTRCQTQSHQRASKSFRSESRVSCCWDVYRHFLPHKCRLWRKVGGSWDALSKQKWQKRHWSSTGRDKSLGRSFSMFPRVRKECQWSGKRCRARKWVLHKEQIRQEWMSRWNKFKVSANLTIWNFSQEKNFSKTWIYFPILRFRIFCTFAMWFSFSTDVGAFNERLLPFGLANKSMINFLCAIKIDGRCSATMPEGLRDVVCITKSFSSSWLAVLRRLSKWTGER